MPELDLADITLHYEISGDGPALMMIGGMMSDSASWAPLVPLLERHFTLIRPDNRTTGRTVPWNAPASLDIFAQDCAALADHLGFGRLHLLGHSMGGLIALRLTRMLPLAGVTLAASAPMRLTRNVALFETLLAIRQSDAPDGTWLRALFRWLFAPTVYDMPGAVDQALAVSLAYPHAQTADAMAHQLAALRDYVPDDLSNLPCPVQALLAADDLLIPVTRAKGALNDIPTHVIANAGHSIHWDAPGTVAAHVTEFIRRFP